MYLPMRQQKRAARRRCSPTLDVAVLHSLLPPANYRHLSHLEAMPRSRSRKITHFLKTALVLIVTSLVPGRGDAYSVQTHEQLIDLTWKNSIVPLLETRFPGITSAQLQEAHSYAYGGCAIQDLGYYPFGNPFFSDLTHYVRSGDFIDSLLRNARTPDELAFAVGALSHYLGDTIGHSEATNPSVAGEFPSLARRFGSVVTYEDNPHDHVRVEFAFDINEIAKHRFAPRRYLEAVGLNVAVDLLTRAFNETYGLRLDKTLRVQRTNLFGYRFSVRHFLPRIAYAETVLRRNHFPDDSPSPDFTRLEADLRQADFDNGWEAYRTRRHRHLHAGPADPDHASGGAARRLEDSRSQPRLGAALYPFGERLRRRPATGSAQPACAAARSWAPADSSEQVSEPRPRHGAQGEPGKLPID